MGLVVLGGRIIVYAICTGTPAGGHPYTLSTQTISERTLRCDPVVFRPTVPNGAGNYFVDIYVVVNYGGRKAMDASFLTLELSFDQAAPDPSTLGLASIALLSLACIRLPRRASFVSQRLQT